MKLLQVRKGQFVYYQNELHKVYSIKPLSKKSVQMYRIKDMKQVVSRADEIDLYKPKHMDSFMFMGAMYTLRQDQKAVVDGYIIITKPDPGYLDHYSLNEFEKVDKLKDGSVYTTLNNTVGEKEFLVMVPKEEPGSKNISYFDDTIITEQQQEEDKKLLEETKKNAAIRPSLGDMYINLDNGIKAMIVVIDQDEVVFGHGERITITDLFESDSWNPIYITEDSEF